MTDKIDKFVALGQAADLTLQIQQLTKDRDLVATVAAAHGATASELAAVLDISRTTAHRRYCAD